MNPILFHYYGNIFSDFEDFHLVLDAGFYIMNLTQLDILWSLYKIDPKNKNIIVEPIKWKNESYKIG